MCIRDRAWASCRAYIQSCDADVVLIQEHHLCTDDQLSQASRWCMGIGYHGVWVRAVQTNRGSSSGVAVLTKVGYSAVRPGSLDREHECSGR
eukprot:11930251-Alexandrium_andersonii.AAC.1